MQRRQHRVDGGLVRGEDLLDQAAFGLGVVVKPRLVLVEQVVERDFDFVFEPGGVELDVGHLAIFRRGVEHGVFLVERAQLRLVGFAGEGLRLVRDHEIARAALLHAVAVDHLDPGIGWGRRVDHRVLECQDGPFLAQQRLVKLGREVVAAQHPAVDLGVEAALVVSERRSFQHVLLDRVVRDDEAEARCLLFDQRIAHEPAQDLEVKPGLDRQFGRKALPALAVQAVDFLAEFAGKAAGRDLDLADLGDARFLAAAENVAHAPQAEARGQQEQHAPDHPRLGLFADAPEHGGVDSG